MGEELDGWRWSSLLVEWWDTAKFVPCAGHLPRKAPRSRLLDDRFFALALRGLTEQLQWTGCYCCCYFCS